MAGQNRLFSLYLLIVALVFDLIGCSHSGTQPPAPQPVLSRETAPGVISVDVLEGGRPEHYWQFELKPSAGLIRIVRQEEFKDSTAEDIPHTYPIGAFGACAQNPNPAAISPDGVCVALCKNSSSADEFSVIGGKTPSSRFEWRRSDREIRGFAWAPNSHSVAVLNVSSYYGKSPLELLSGLSGHPVPHDTVFLDIIDVQTGQPTEYLIRKNVVYSFTRILSWSQ